MATHLPVEAACLVPYASVVAPLGMVHQFSINEHAKQIEKYWLTHYQSITAATTTVSMIAYLSET